MLHDDRKTTRPERTVLRRLLPDADLRAYDRNRNDYAGYNLGRDALDAALRDKAWEISHAIEDASRSQDREAHRHIASEWCRDNDMQAARDGYEALAATLDGLAKQARDVAFVLDLRVGDDRADTALDTFTDALMGR